MKLKNLLNSKFTILILSSFLLLQSCQVYHSKASSIAEVIESENRVKVTQTTGNTYKFKRIDRIDGQLIGIAKKKSKVAKKLESQIISKNKDIVKIKLDENSIKKMRLQNKSKSTIATIGLTVVGVGVLSYLALGAALGGF